jgi:hypothetical protein
MPRPFNIATDVEVAIYTYSSNTFVWNVSRWDEDYWSDGTSTQDWQVISCDVVSVYTNNGINVERGYTKPQVSTAEIMYTGTDYDPFVNSTVRPGTPIRVRVLINPDTAFQTWVTIWQGVVTNCAVSYQANSWLNLVTLECEQSLREVLNYVAEAGITVSSPCYAKDFITAINTQAGSNIQASTSSTLIGYELDPLSVTIPVNFGNLLNILTDTNLGAILYRPILGSSTNPYYWTWADIEANATTPSVIFEGQTSATINRADFSDIIVGFDTAQYVNTLHYSTVSGVDDAIQNSDSVELVGNLEGTVTTRHFYATDADASAEQVVATIPTRAVERIIAPVILRSTGGINNYLLLDPLATVQVLVSNDRVEIDETYYVTNVTYEITRDYWNATYDLWIGR